MKLLNFFLTKSPERNLIFQFPWGDYDLPSYNGMNWIVKLGDFGTTEIGIEGNISVGQVECDSV